MSSTVEPHVPASTGTTRFVKLNVPGASATLARFPASLRLHPHVHEKACLTVLLDGVMSEHIGGRERYCEQASVLIKPGLERHDDLCGRSGSTQIIIEPHDPNGDVLDPGRKLWSSVRFFRDTDAERLARRLALELDHPDDVTPLAAAALTFELFTVLARRGSRTRHADQPPVWLQRVRTRLTDSPGEILSLVTLAREAGVHPAHLGRAFRMHYGCSIGTFVRQLRVRAAADDLATTDMAIAGIAAAHGFVDQSHFNRQFRKLLGVTPREYRERFRSR
jgi:AraC family transcriptional regulator